MLYYPWPFRSNYIEESLPNNPAVVQTIASSITPYDIEKLKLAMRVDVDSEDDTITAFANAACQLVEEYTKHALTSATYVQTQRIFGSRDKEIAILRWPVTAISSIKYYDTDSAQQTISSSDYRLVSNTKPSIIVPTGSKTWPDTDYKEGSVEITFVAGSATLASLPPLVTRAIYEIATYFYENRQQVITGVSVNELPDGLRIILDQIRIFYSV